MICGKFILITAWALRLTSCFIHRILKTLKPLELNRRLMLSPMASADVSALVFSQMATGRWLLDVEWGFSQMDGVDTSRVVQAERERLII